VKFKIEIALLILAIAFYVVGVFCYFYEAPWEGMLPVINYPYRVFALPLAGIATTLLVITIILYSKRK
jgi:uncharacterized membrane protein